MRRNMQDGVQVTTKKKVHKNPSLKRHTIFKVPEMPSCLNCLFHATEKHPIMEDYCMNWVKDTNQCCFLYNKIKEVFDGKA